MIIKSAVCLLINCGVILFLPLLEEVFRKHQRPIGGSWLTDEPYIKAKGVWKYLYRIIHPSLIVPQTDNVSNEAGFACAINSNPEAQALVDRWPLGSKFYHLSSSGVVRVG
jgi:hypothetical protein